MSQLRARKYHILKVIVYALRGRIFVGINLVSDNLSLLAQLLFGICRAEDNIRYKLHSTRKVVAQSGCVERSILLCSIGIKFASEILQTAVHLICLTALCTLEQGVLGKVGDAILRGALIARARVHDKGTMCYATTHLAVDTTNTIRECICLKLFHFCSVLGIDRCSFYRTP